MSIRENKRGRKKETEEEEMVKTVKNIIVKHLYFQFEHSIYICIYDLGG